jgi:plasmid stabilization system protein ParE
LKVVWSPEALEDLEEAIGYLAARNPTAATKLATAVIATVEQRATEPLDGPEHVLRNGERVRGWPHRPFRVYYQRTPEAFFVVRVYHQRREPIAR